MGELLLSTIVISVDDKKLGIKLKQARLENGLSQEDVAGKIGLTWEMISRYENGRSSAIKHLEKLAKIYKKPITYFLGEEENKDTFKIDDIVKKLKDEGIGYSATKKNVVKVIEKFSGRGLEEDINTSEGLYEITSNIADKYEDIFAVKISENINLEKTLQFELNDILLFSKSAKMEKDDVIIGYDGINYEIIFHKGKNTMMPLAKLVSLQRKFD